MNLLYAQGVDASMLLYDFEGFELLPGDFVRAQFRLGLFDDPVAEVGQRSVTAQVDAAAQTILVKIPEAVNVLWQPTLPEFPVYTTLLVIGADSTHRLAIEVSMLWRASFTRGPGL